MCKLARIDWQSVRENTTAHQLDESLLFTLPHAGRLLLLAIIDRLEWEATYRVDGYDFADWDDLQAIVQETKHGLMQ